ncbi:hypothetical protein W97_06465 [Coniosporium apollinis CBS 100218]|uniref:BHLH domain-containing protein n=1 Tax=Coniosporium apollinis (strain CBS 100218) TaxID=1168221 RepID=R7YZ80_CONA1|nr:uncharacterized protein W97_06465 [Coniosporium apollinis CBS 100218]EON67212.1 hypothetical protein W97_06465 [Coniosporium apollinis CBS 100218]
MSLNWDTFMNEEELNRLTNDQWVDTSFQQRTTTQAGGSAPLLPFSQSLNTPLSAPNYSPWDFASQDSYFPDSAYFAPQDYQYGDPEALQAFGDALTGPTTSQPSHDHTPGIITNDYALQQARAERRASSSATAYTASDISNSISNPSTSAPPPTISEAQYDSLLSNHADAGFLDNIAYPHRTSGASNPPNRATETPAQATNPELFTDTMRKRHRGNGRSDAIQACWLSPLCPNSNKDSTPPSPSTCGGACAPFLFGPGADDPSANVTIDQQMLAKDSVGYTSPENLEFRRHLKRSESDASVAPTGRLYNESSEEPGLKTESTEDTPERFLEHLAAEDAKGKGQKRRQPHNQVEKKYRESLNTQLESLRRVVPSLRQNARSCDGADIEDLPTPSKPSKAVVLASATSYIKQMERERQQLREENEMLKSRIKALQTLAKCQDCSLMHFVRNLKIDNPN